MVGPLQDLHAVSRRCYVTLLIGPKTISLTALTSSLTHAPNHETPPKHRRFWATDDNRKSIFFFLFGALWRHLVCNVKPQTSNKRAKKGNIWLPVAVRGSRTSLLKLPVKRLSSPIPTIHILEAHLNLIVSMILKFKYLCWNPRALRVLTN